MRLTAAVIVFALCALEGQRRRLALKNRAGLLEELLLMLNGFAIEISCRALTPDELIQMSGGRFAESVRAKRGGFPDIKAAWEAACAELPKSRERELLSELGRALGTTDKSGQLRLIELYRAELETLKGEAEEGYRRKGAAFSRVGLLCGAAAAVLIL